MTQGFERSSKFWTNCSTYLFLQLIQHIQVAARSTSPYMTTVFYGRYYGRFIEIQSKLRKHKLHKMNQDSHFLGGSFGNTDNVRTPVQEKQKRNRASASYRLFFLKSSCIQFHFNSTRVISLAKQNKLSFFQHRNQQATSCSNRHCFIGQIQVQKPTPIVATKQKPYHI